MTMKKGEMLSIAIQIAVEAHAGQFDRGGKPYILHPLYILYKLREEDEETQCIGVLHDSVEDNRKITYAYLRERGMSERVIDGVRCITKVPGETEEEYLEKVLSNVDTMKAKKEDLNHNSKLSRLKGVTEKDLDRNKKYQKMYFVINNKLNGTEK